MYFDFASFKKSLQGYTEPLCRTVHESYHEIPMVLIATRKGCHQYWVNNKPKSIGGVLGFLLFNIFMLLVLLLFMLWSAFHNLERNEPGWLIMGFFLGLYALSIPIALLILVLFNTKFGLPNYPQTWTMD